ncbi:hypothetical protein ABK040_005350 [Willaertia magna]
MDEHMDHYGQRAVNLEIFRYCDQSKGFHSYKVRKQEMNEQKPNISWWNSLSTTLPIEKCYLTEDQSNSDNIPVTGLKIGCFNVLFDILPFFVQSIARSKERYLNIIKLLKYENFDFLVLNEVTSNFLILLQQDPWIRENYFLSDVYDENFLKGKGNEYVKTIDTVNHSLGTRMGNLILSRYPPDELIVVYDIIHSRPGIYVTFSYSVPKEEEEGNNNETVLKRMCFIGCHTTAFEEYAEVRRMELRKLTSIGFLEVVDDIVLLGDLNLHKPQENSIISEIGFRDLWNETRKEDSLNKGYTFDPYENTLIQCMYLGMENRRMRLDRILIDEKSLWTCKTRVEMFANQPMYELLPKIETSKVNQVLNTPNWWSKGIGKLHTRDGNDYLFCSDHFGLKTHLIRSATSKALENHKEKVLNSREIDLDKC